jgi:hypothetical protein
MVSTIGTTTYANPVIWPLQEKCFYANGRWWVFYYDGSNFGWRTSTDGSSWSTFNTYAAIISARFSVWYDEANNKICLAKCQGATANIYYRQGTANSDGTITWDSNEVQVTTDAGYDVTVCKDSTGYPWISYLQPTTWNEKVVKATATNGSAWGTPTTLWTNRATGSENLKIVPLTGGKMLAISCANGLVLQSRLYDGSTWASAVNASTSTPQSYVDYDAVADGDNVHLAFCKVTSYDIVYVKYTYGTGWGSEETVESATVAQYHPSITLKDTDKVRVFYLKTQTNIRYRDRDSGSWQTAVDISTTESTMTCVTSSYKAYSSKICVTWKSGASSPYNVQFEGYSLAQTAYADRNFTLTAEIPVTALVDKDFILTIGTYTISDITRDAGGDIIGNCTVQLFRTSDKAFVAETTSNASGEYSFTINSKVRQHFLIGYKSGTPNRFGTSDRNVVANGSPSQFWGLRPTFDANPKDVRQYFLQYQAPVDRSFTLIEGITSLVDRTLSVNLWKLALNDKALTTNVKLTNVTDRSFGLTVEKFNLADRTLSMNVWKSALQDRSVMSIIELFEFLNRSVSASIEPTVLIDRNVSAFIEPTHLIDAKFSLQSELTAFADRTATLDMAGLSHRSLSANIEPYTYVGYEHRNLAVNVELTNAADRNLQLTSELTSLADKTLSASVALAKLADRSFSLGMEVYGFANASHALSVEQTLLKSRNLSAIIELFSTNDKSVSVFVEPTVFADRNFAIQVVTRGLSDKNLISNVERFLLVDRPLTLSTDKGLDTDRSLTLQAERTLFADSQLTAAVELPTISDRSLNLVAEKILLNDRQFILSAEKFGLADSNLSVFVEPTRFSDVALTLQSEVTFTADSLLQLNSELFTVSDRNQTVVVELTSLADSSLSVSIELPTVSDRQLSLNVERTFSADSTLTLNSELTLYDDRSLFVNAERTLQTDGLLSLSMEALRYADRPLSLNAEVPFAVQDRNLSVFIEPTHLTDANLLANIERFSYLDKALALNILYRSTNDKSLALTTELTAIQDDSLKLNVAGLLFRNTITNIALPKLTDRSLSMEVEVPYTQKDRPLTLDVELLHKLAYPPLKVKFT